MERNGFYFLDPIERNMQFDRSLGMGEGLKNIGLPNVGANMVNLASNPLLANAGTGLGANPLLSNTPFASPKLGLNANINGKPASISKWRATVTCLRGIWSDIPKS